MAVGVLYCFDVIDWSFCILRLFQDKTSDFKRWQTKCSIDVKLKDYTGPIHFYHCYYYYPQAPGSVVLQYFRTRETRGYVVLVRQSMLTTLRHRIEWSAPFKNKHQIMPLAFRENMDNNNIKSEIGGLCCDAAQGQRPLSPLKKEKKNGSQSNCE